MKSTCFISPVAEQDIEAIENLADHPEMGHSREDLTDQPVKFLTFKWHYLIIYKPCIPVEIVRVLSGYRDLINLM